MFTVGVFADVTSAERGIAALLADGFSPASVTILAKASPEASALVGAHLGGDAAILELNRLGPVAARGPLLRTLEGHDDGLRVKGLAGTFARAGFQPHDGHIYETLVSRGGVLVALQNQPRAADALAKLHAYGGGNAAIGAWVGRL